MNQAPHTLDQFLWIGGAPQSVQAIATTRLHNIEVENTALAICDYGNGKVGMFYATTAEAPTSERIEVIGDKGVLTYSDGLLRRADLSASVSQHLGGAVERFGGLELSWHDVEIEAEAADPFREVHRAFAHAVRAKDPSLLVATGEDGLRALELGNAILLAGYTRREVKLPLATGAFEAMLEKLQNGTKPESLRG